MFVRSRRSLRVRRGSIRPLVPIAATIRLETLEERVLLSAVLPGLNEHGVVIGNGTAAGREALAIGSGQNHRLSDNAQGSGLVINLNNQNGQISSLKELAIRDVIVANNGNAGIQIHLANMTLDRLAIDRAAVTGNGGSGLYLNLQNVQIGEIVIWDSANPADPDLPNSGDSAYSENAFDGVHFLSNDSRFGRVRVISNQMQDNAGHGMAFNLNNVSMDVLSLNDNEATGNTAGSGFHFNTNRTNVGSQNGRIVNNTLTGNSSHGISFISQSLLPGSVPTLTPSNFDFRAFADNTISDNQGSGVSIDLRQMTTWDATLHRNTISNNQLRGFDLKAIDTESAFDVQIGGLATNPQEQLVNGNTFDANVGAAIALELNDATGDSGDTTGRFRILGNTITGTVAQPGSLIFRGEGINISARGDVTRQNGAARYFQSVIDRNTINGNAGDGVLLNITEDSELIDLTIGNMTGRNQTFDVNGPGTGGGAVPTVAGDGNLISNNGGNGISLIRRSSAYVKNIRILDNQITTNAREGIYVQASNTYITVPNAARPGQAVITDVTIERNTIQGNLLNGVHGRTEADAVLLLNLRYNRIDGNAINGVRLTGLENNTADFENIGGTWTKNAITNNNLNGVAIENVVGSINPLIIGQDGNDAQDGQSLGNYIAFNGEDGIEVGARAGAGGTVMPMDVRDGMEIVNNQIVNNGLNAFGDPYNAGKGIDIEVLQGQAREFRIDRNVIQGNGGDGIELLNRGGLMRITAVGNFIDLNGGRGVDLLSQAATPFNAETFVRFGDAGTTLAGGVNVSNRNFILNNGLEGFYVVNTVADTQTQNVASHLALEFITIGNSRTEAGVRANLILDVENNEIRDNGLGIPGSESSSLSGTGLVLRVGSQYSGSGMLTEPDLTGDVSWNSDSARAGVGSNDIQGPGTVDVGWRTSGNGRVNARIVDNEFSGNAGDDVLIEGFLSLQPRTTNGTWNQNDFALNTTVYDRDPLARLNLEFHGNTGDSLDVVRGFGANDAQTYAYDNNESDFKSRTSKTSPNVSGPHGSNGSRARSINNVAGPAFIPGTPGNAENYWYDGWGESTFRIESDWDVSGFTSNNLGDNFSFLTSAGPSSPVASGWDYVAPGTFSFMTAWINDVTVNEADGTASLTVTLSEAAGPGGVTVWYKTTDGSAVADLNDPTNGDYEAVTEAQFFSVTIAAGETSAQIPITIYDNDAYDEIEQFYVDLYMISHGEFVDSRGIVTILPGASTPPSITVDDIVVDEVNGTAEFTIELSHASSEFIWVDYTTVGGTAVDGVDFAGRGGTVAFTPGDTTLTVSVVVIPDTLDETDETFQIQLSNAVGGTIIDASATATIRDTRYFSVSDVEVDEGGTATVTIKLNEPLPPGLTATVNWATANGTATASSDYVADSGTLTFVSGGPTVQTITIDTVDTLVDGDPVNEGDEVFFVNLSGATEAGIAKDSGRITIVDPWDATSDLDSNTGVAEADGWSVNVGDHSPGYMLFGPWTTVVPGGLQKATFRLQVDNAIANNARIVRIDVRDSNNGRTLAQRVIHRREFTGSFEYQDFDLLFQNTPGIELQFRVFWYGTSYVKADNVRVTTATAPALTFEGETDFAHRVGRAVADGWMARPALDPAGFMAFGINTTDVPAGPQSAAFRLKVDNHAGNNQLIARIDVMDSSVGRVLAQRVIRRSDFAGSNQYQDFVLDFINTAGRQLDFRVFYYATSIVTLDAVLVTADPTPPLLKFEAETDGSTDPDGFHHVIGRWTADGWSASAANDSPGFLTFGPFTTSVPGGTHAALFRMLVNSNTGNNAAVARIDVVEDGRVVAQRIITRHQFDAPHTYQNFALQFTNSDGKPLQFRVYWFGSTFLQLDHVAIVDYPAPQVLAEAEGARSGHAVGRADGDGWSANTLDDSPGFLVFGPWTPKLPSGSYTADFRLLVDNNTANNAPIVTIQVVDLTTGQVLATQLIRRQMFAQANTYQNFSLTFAAATGNPVQFTTYWHGTSYVKQDRVSAVPTDLSIAELDSVFTEVDELLLMS